MILLLFLAASWLNWSTAASSLWPEPIAYSSEGDVLWIPSDLKASFSCGDNSTAWSMTSIGASSDHSLFERSQQRLSQLLGDWQPYFGHSGSIHPSDDNVALSEDEAVRSAVRRALKEVAESAFVPWKFHSRTSNFEPGRDHDGPVLSGIQVYQRRCPGSGFVPSDFFNADESYALKIRDRVAVINSASSIGTINALSESNSHQFHAYIGDFQASSDFS